MLELPCCSIPLIVGSAIIRRFTLDSTGGKQRLLRYCFSRYPGRTWRTGKLSTKTAATVVSCSLNPAAWQAIRTPDLWLEQGPLALQSTGSRISERDDCAESKSSERFRGVSSADDDDDDAPGTVWGNGRMNEFVMLLHIPLARCAPSPNPQFPLTQLSPVPPLPLLPFLFLCFV